MKKRLSSLLLIAVSVVAGYMLYSKLSSGGNDKPNNYLQVVNAVANKNVPVKSLKVLRGESVTAVLSNKSLESEYPDEQSLADLVKQAQQRQTPVIVSSPRRSIWKDLILQLVPMLIFIGLLLFVLSRSGSFGKLLGGKRFQSSETTDTPITFSDVAGLGEASAEVREVVDFLRNPDRYAKLGARVPRGVLFVGQPGTGKTLLAKAVAGESEAAFFSLTGSDFVEMFAGLGANRVRQLFTNAREQQPAIVFIDEIDAVGRSRSGGGLPGNDEREQTLNQLLSEMDGFGDNEAVVVIAATNRPDVLDAALMRPGRFDRQIHIDPPDRKGRLEILKVHSKGKPIEAELLPSLAQQTPGFTGAELANLLNEAAIVAARRKLEKIDEECLEAALLRVIAGLESNRLLSDEERGRIAYHEVGHALCAHYTEHRTPVHKISMVSRGRALGFTISIPEQDRLLETRASLIDKLTMLMGGRAAEKAIFGSFSSGAANDLERATALATQMVAKMGLSEVIGPRVIAGNEENYQPGTVDLGSLRCSQDTAQKVENEVAEVLAEASQAASKLLQEHHDELERVVAALKEKETLQADDFLAMLDDSQQ
jgi:cell division protease FtsH